MDSIAKGLRGVCIYLRKRKVETENLMGMSQKTNQDTLQQGVLQYALGQDCVHRE